MRTPTIFIAATMLATGTLHAADEPQNTQDTQDTLNTLKAEDIFNLEYASSPAVSPDGKQIVYVRRSNDIMADRTRSNLWIANADGTGHMPLMSGRDTFTSPVWSPDGSRIAFVSNQEGSTQLYVHWLESGRTALVSNLQESPGSVTWSPDGKRIAFTMTVPADHKPLSVKMPKKPKGAKWNDGVKYVSKAQYQRDGRGILEPAYTHVFILPAEGGSARQLTSGDYDHRGPLSFSADGSEILFSTYRADDWEYERREADIYAVDMNGTLRQVTSTPGAEHTPVVSPDGKTIAFLASDDKKLAYRITELKLMPFEGGDATSLTADLDRSVSNPIWDKRGRGLYFQIANHGMEEVHHTDLKGKRKLMAGGLGGTTLGRPYTSGDFDAKGGTLAFTRGRTDRPADLFSMRGEKTHQLTELNEDALGHKVLGDVHEITYASAIDGEEIQGWYMTPPGFDPSKKYPLILEIHGGPHLSYGPNFSAEMQRYAAEGYVVFYDNHRGSTGYGERFALLLQNKYSSEYDFSDHNSGVDAMIAKGFIDADQLYITGGSAGGIATAYAVGLTNRFRAAAVAKPVINWISKVLTADSYLYQVPNQFPGMPWDHVEHYWKRSPLSLVGNVTTPTMLITGEADRRTPISETEQFYQALKLKRVDTLMVRVPDSPHGIAGRPSRLIAKVENILAWFEKYK